jgi:hypothetical protein
MAFRPGRKQNPDGFLHENGTCMSVRRFAIGAMVIVLMAGSAAEFSKLEKKV